MERQVAEKLHAYTRTYENRRTTRARDLVDLLLIRQHGQVDATLLSSALRRVFQHRGTHAVPERLPPPPRDLAVGYRREAAYVGIGVGLEEAHRLLAGWLDPVLGGISHPPPAGDALRP